MPFTLAHAAAALPFRRTRLIFSALVVGCFAPDFADFIRLGPASKFGHTFTGLFVFDIPVSLAVLWLFHRYAKEPLWTWLPEDTRRKVKLGPPKLPISSPAGFALIVFSILVGSTTHLVWDWFTHLDYWPYQHWEFLRRAMELPAVGNQSYIRLIQYGSSVFGIVVLLLWWMYWSITTAPSRAQESPSPGTSRRWVPALLICIALVVAAIRTLLGAGLPVHHHISQLFLTELATTAITVLWLEIVLYGMARARSRKRTEVTVNHY